MADCTPPRRCRIDLYSPAEKAIADAMAAVEAAGASLALTDAVVLLQAAKDRVADHVDGVDGRRTFVRFEHAPEAASETAAARYDRLLGELDDAWNAMTDEDRKDRWRSRP